MSSLLSLSNISFALLEEGLKEKLPITKHPRISLECFNNHKLLIPHLTGP